MVDFLGFNPFQLFSTYVQTGALGKRAGFESIVYHKGAMQGIPKKDLKKIMSGQKYEMAWRKVEEKAPFPLIVNQPSPDVDLTKIFTIPNLKNLLLIGGLIIGGIYLAGKYIGKR